MSELREAIARAIGTYLEGKNFSVFGGTEAVLSADDFCLPIDTLEVADAALAAIEARGMVVVPKEPHIGPDYEVGLWSRRNWEALLRDHYAMTAAARTED